MPLTTKNTVFYSTANAGYALFAATSLLGIRKYLSDAQLCVISSGLSDYDRRILDRHSIDYHEIDLSGIFTQTWDYPIDCYNLFSGPEIFYKQGFKYSVYVDGDVLCMSDPLKEVDEIECVAGVESASVNDEYISIFKGDWEKIREVWNLQENTSKRKRVNAGVVYFNNHKMVSIKLLEKAGDLYKKSLQNNIPRKGDDSLFSLLQYVHLKEEDVKVLPPEYNYVLQFHDKWISPKKKMIFFHFSIDKPWKNKPYSHKNERLNLYNPLVKAWRRSFRRTALRAWLLNTVLNFQRVDTGINLLVKISEKIKQVINDQYLWAIGLKLSLPKRRLNFRKSPLKIFWWRSEKKVMLNFGDEITATIVEKLFGFRSERSEIEDCELIGTGSILEIAGVRKTTNKIKVWGSGFIKEKSKDDNLVGLEFFAVRGEKTRGRVMKEVTLGDPGLLVNLVYKKATYKTDKIGVVIHYIDLDLPIVQEIRQDPRFIIINPLDKPEKVAREITSCKFILSSSLHGLIFSDSFSIPNIHVKLSERLSGGVYKFEDYYSAIGKEYAAADAEKIFDMHYLDELIAKHRPVQKLQTIQRGLIEAFPYK